MRVFVTGATGFIGSAVVAQLLERGHQVTGLARSEAAAAALTAAGAHPHRGSLEDPQSLRRAAGAADGAIHLAFFHQFGHASLATRARVVLGGSPRRAVQRFLAATVSTDRTAISTIGGALSGPDRPFVAAFGTLALTPGTVATEDAPVDPASVGAPRGAAEQLFDELAERGVRASVVRLPPIVHGDGDRNGFLPTLVRTARKHGAAGYAGDGANRWPSVHRLDAARLLVRALEDGAPGARYHGVADEGVPFADIAGSIAAGTGLPAQSLTPEQISARYSFLAPFVGVDNPASSAVTRQRLGWAPTEKSLLDDLAHGEYFLAV